MLKIAFIEPPYNNCKIVHRPQLAAPPLWMLSLGTYLKEAIGRGVKVEAFDGQILSLKQISDKLKAAKPDFIGMCPKHSSYSNALIIARKAKESGARVIFGGPHAGFLAQEILSNRGPASADYCVDACISGDGEKAFYEYVTGKNFAGIKNLVFVKNRKIVENHKEYLDFAVLPPVDHELIDAKKYSPFNNHRRRMFPVYSYKGCFSGYFGNRACIFCGGDKKLRTRPPLDFWKEVDGLTKKYGAKYIFNFADGFPIDPGCSWFREFRDAARLCKNKPKLGLRTLPHFISDRTVGILKELNVTAVRMPLTGVFPGCAFGPARISAKKDLFAEIRRPFELLSKAGIKVSTHLKLGAFGEGDGDVEILSRLCGFLSSLREVDVVFARGFLPFPGSKGWQIILNKTGGKYKNKDLIDWQEVGRDWLKFFSDIKNPWLLRSLDRSMAKVSKQYY